MVDPDASDRTRTNIVIGGFDRELNDKLILGAALDYSRTNAFGASSWGISPYLAYKFTDTVFAIVRAGYSRSESDVTTTFTDPITLVTTTTTSSQDIDTYSAAVSLNAAHRMENLLLRGRVEVGYSDSDNFSGTTQFVGDGELGYIFAPGLYGFAGLQAGRTDKSSSYALFGRIGLEKEFAPGAAVQVKWEHKLDDNFQSGVDIDTITLAARFRF